MTPDPTPDPTPGRKPGQAVRPADEIAIENLSQSVSRLRWYLATNPSDNLGVRLARCAKAGVDKARAEKGLQMIEADVAMARTQFEAAYAAPVRDPEKPATRPTVSL